MSGSVVKVWVIFIALAAAAYGGFAAYRASREENPGGAAANGRSGTENAAPITLDPSPKPMTGLDKLTLIEKSGANFRFATLRGHVWVANSFFSSCPGECKMLTAVMRSLQNEFPELRLVSMTCDPTNDTPEALKEYAKVNGADPVRWSFVTGKAFDLQAANIELLMNDKIGINHSKHIAVVDADGKWQAMHNGMDVQDLEKLREKIRRLLAAK